jgi:hypothetical protein
MDGADVKTASTDCPLLLPPLSGPKHCTVPRFTKHSPITGFLAVKQIREGSPDEGFIDQGFKYPDGRCARGFRIDSVLRAPHRPLHGRLDRNQRPVYGFL